MWDSTCRNIRGSSSACPCRCKHSSPLGTLNRIVNAYIEFAELRALQRQVMTMRDWIAKLDDFLKLSEHELLDHAGRITAEQAKLKAELEYDRYQTLMDSQPWAE